MDQRFFDEDEAAPTQVSALPPQLPGVGAEAIEQVPLAISHEATEAWPGEIGAEVVEDIWPPSGRDPYLERVSGAAAYALSPSLAFGEDDDTGGGQARSA